MQLVVGQFIELMHPLRQTVVKDITRLPWDFWHSFVAIARRDSMQQSVIPHQVNHKSFTALANMHGSDQGDTLRDAHHYTQYCERIFAALPESNRLDILEIGLNYASTSSAPSLSVYRDYFSGLGESLSVTGFDVLPAFKAFEDLPRIRVIIGNQSNPTDLEQCQDKAYDVIVDNGYSRLSRHQQTSLMTLWKAIKPGGCYLAIDNLYYKPQPGSVGLTKTKDMLLQWQRG